MSAWVCFLVWGQGLAKMSAFRASGLGVRDEAVCVAGDETAMGSVLKVLC